VAKPKFIGQDIEKEEFLNQYGIDTLVVKLLEEMTEKKPEYPLTNMVDWLEEKKSNLPEVYNTKAADPDFWRNYWQTDSIKWQSPEVSPWLKNLAKMYFKKSKNH
jgi:hypothetical protein